MFKTDVNPVIREVFLGVEKLDVKPRCPRWWFREEGHSNLTARLYIRYGRRCSGKPTNLSVLYPSKQSGSLDLFSPKVWVLMMIPSFGNGKMTSSPHSCRQPHAWHVSGDRSQGLFSHIGNRSILMYLFLWRPTRSEH